MTDLLEDRREQTVHYLKTLRDRVVKAFEALEATSKETLSSPPTLFVKKHWSYEKGAGGGEISILRGQVFEKAAVNWSGVSGETFPMADGAGAFFATGVSLITHLANPKAPTVHFNIRWIQTEAQSWFAGGFDLTPMGFPFPEDTQHFHQVAEKALAPFAERGLSFIQNKDNRFKNLYEAFAQEAREYYVLKHYQKERGVGGIFFDHWNTGDWEWDFQLWKSVGDHFLESILPIYERRIHLPFSEEDRALQLKKRAHYVEFNLLYDRGTQFGFRSGGNPEAILCSLPPLVAW